MPLYYTAILGAATLAAAPVLVAYPLWRLAERLAATLV